MFMQEYRARLPICGFGSCYQYLAGISMQIEILFQRFYEAYS